MNALEAQAASANISPVARALEGGWRAFRARPGLLGGWLLILLISTFTLQMLVLGILAVGSAAADAPEAPARVSLAGIAVASGLLLAVGTAVLLPLWVGLGFTALRVVRGEVTGSGNVFTGLRRGFAVLATAVIAGLLVVLPALGALVATLAVSGAGVDALSARWAGSPEAAATSATLGGLVAFAGHLAWVVALWYGLSGVALWPLVLLDQAAGPWQALRRSWALMRGRRLALVGLYIALSALNFLGWLALGVGAVVTLAISIAAYAAFYAAACGEPVGEVASGWSMAPITGEPVAPTTGEPSSTARWRRVRWSALAVDCWVVVYGLAAAWLAVLVASIAPIIEINQSSWSPYGPVLLLLPMVLPPLVLLPLYWLAARWSGASLGRRIAGEGWGRFEWLAAPLILSGLVFMLGIGRIYWNTVPGIAALGVGHEMARQIARPLPAGHASVPDADGASDWFDALVVDDPDTGAAAISASYTITDALGSAHAFKLVRYDDEAMAVAAMGRLGGAAASPAPDLGPAAITTRDAELPPPGPLRPARRHDGPRGRGGRRARRRAGAADGDAVGAAR